jgi:hypothetical protein
MANVAEVQAEIMQLGLAAFKEKEAKGKHVTFNEGQSKNCWLAVSSWNPDVN